MSYTINAALPMGAVGRTKDGVPVFEIRGELCTPREIASRIKGKVINVKAKAKPESRLAHQVRALEAEGKNTKQIADELRLDPQLLADAITTSSGQAAAARTSSSAAQPMLRSRRATSADARREGVGRGRTPTDHSMSAATAIRATSTRPVSPRLGPTATWATPITPSPVATATSSRASRPRMRRGSTPTSAEQPTGRSFRCQLRCALWRTPPRPLS